MISLRIMEKDINTFVDNCFKYISAKTMLLCNYKCSKEYLHGDKSKPYLNMNKNMLRLYGKDFNLSSPFNCIKLLGHFYYKGSSTNVIVLDKEELERYSEREQDFIYEREKVHILNNDGSTLEKYSNTTHYKNVVDFKEYIADKSACQNINFSKSEYISLKEKFIDHLYSLYDPSIPYADFSNSMINDRPTTYTLKWFDNAS